MLTPDFFNCDVCLVAQSLLGKVIYVKHNALYLKAQIVETEAYYLVEKGSHASLGFTEKRKPLFMPPGTIYMYYARGGDSFNISTRGKGNSVLIKSGRPYGDHPQMFDIMQQLNPRKNSMKPREISKLCAGQTLLCKSLDLKVPKWSGQQFDRHNFYLMDKDYNPEKIIQTTRLGIPKGRDEELHYRYIDFSYADYCTDNPLRKRKWQENQDYFILQE